MIRYLSSLIVGGFLTLGQFTTPQRSLTPMASSSTPVHIGSCSGGNVHTSTTASCTATATSSEPIVVFYYNASTSGGTPVLTSSSGTVTQIGSCTTSSSVPAIYCLAIVTGATNPTLTNTVTSGNYPSLLADVWSGVSGVDGGTSTCNGSTGCNSVAGTSTSATQSTGSITVSGNDGVTSFCFINVGGPVLTATSTPVAFTLGANLSGNIRSFYGTYSPSGTVTPTVNVTVSTGNPFACAAVAMH